MEVFVFIWIDLILSDNEFVYKGLLSYVYEILDFFF